VRFVSAMPNSNFQITQDAGDPQKIHIKNTKAISGSQTAYVRFVVDMSDVPVGYTVANTVGGNTTKTVKLSTQILGSKTVDGQTPKSGETFSFLLKDSQGKTLQTVQNQGKSIAFLPLKYDTADLGKTFTYTVEEGTVPAGYTKDESQYTVTVKLGTEADSQGRIPIIQTVTKNGKTVSAIAFDNKGPKGSLKIDKQIAGALKAENLTDAQKKALTFKVTGPSANPKTYTFTYADMTNGEKTLTDLDPGTYTVTEIAGHLDGYTYTCQIDGKTQTSESVTVTSGKTAAVTVTDTYAKSAVLPKAGGAGIDKILLGGGLMMLAALGWAAIRKQRE
jgi:LPXTG-motif cell wall-anchored protein